MNPSLPYEPTRRSHAHSSWGSFVLGLLFLTAIGKAGDTRVRLIPELHPGQTLRYDIRGRAHQFTKTASPVTKYTVPRDLKEEISSILRVTIKDVGEERGKPVVSATAEFEVPATGAPGSDGNAPAPKRAAEFTIDNNGQVKTLSGADDWSGAEKIAFASWVSKFAFGWTIPGGREWKPGETWKSEEPESVSGPIARLIWERTTTYGQKSKCAIIEAQWCASFLTTASLKQKSPPTDTTPEDYKLHELKTSGTASGKNETFDSISLETGLLMRGTEDAQQSMVVVIAKSNGSNRVRYTVEAGSHFEMLLVSGEPK